MYGAKVACPLNASTPLADNDVFVTGRCTITAQGASTVMVLCVPEGGAPSASTVQSTGSPVTSTLPLVLDDPAGSPLPNLARYFACPASGSLVAGDLRVVS